MTTLLIMTVGHTDVQLVSGNQRHKLDGNTCGTLHDAIKERLWSVLDAPNARSRDIIKVLPEGELPLCTPKLDAVLSYLDSSLPGSVLIFETNRQHEREPRFAGEVMERRLRDRGVESVTRVAFLTGDEQLEDPSKDVDTVVRRSVVATLSNALSLATTGLTHDDRVFMATTGGLAAANELINELVRLYCVGGPVVRALEVPDGDRTHQADRAVEEKFHPAAGYRARWHALSLVEKGNFLGAWGAVSHLEGAPGQEWTQVIRWLACFASSLPIPDECDLEELKPQPMATRVALRVESALRAGDIPRAVHGTVAFFEAALLDLLQPRLSRHPSNKGWCAVSPLPDAALIRPNGNRNREKPFEVKEQNNGKTWYKVHHYDSEGAKKLVHEYLNSSPLQKLEEAITQFMIRDLRNDVAHNEPTPELMKNASSSMRGAALWSNDNQFLIQPIVKDVLRELGETDPEHLLVNLLAEVRRRLVVAS